MEGNKIISKTQSTKHEINKSFPVLTCPLARGIGSIRSTPSAYIWMSEKMSRAFTASHSVWSRDVESGHFLLAKRFSVYLAMIKSFLVCLMRDRLECSHRALVIVCDYCL